MKKKFLFSAIFSILICLCLMGGATFALFTDKATVDIAITAGTVDVDAKVVSIKTYTNTTKIDEGTSVAKFENGGVATVDNNKVTIDRMTPMDKVVITLSLENLSNVNIKYRTTFNDITDASALVKLFPALEFATQVEGEDAVALGQGVVSDWALLEANGTIKTFDLIIAFPDHGEDDNQYQGGECDLRFTIEAVQGNAPVKVASAEEFATALESGEEFVQLTSNLTLDAPVSISTDTVLDLNGKTLSGTSTSSTTSYLVNVAEGAELTLTNGVVSFSATNPDTQWGGEGQPPFPGYANNAIVCKGSLVIDGATIINNTAPGGASYAIDCYPGANLVINSGLIDGAGKVAIRMFANSATEETNVTINGGKIIGSRAIWMQLPGSDSNVAMKANLTVNGGELISTGENGGYKLAIYTYSFGNSFAESSVILNGGKLDGDVALNGSYVTDKSLCGEHKNLVIDRSKCSITGNVYSYNPQVVLP